MENYPGHSRGLAGEATLCNKIEMKMATTTFNQTIATNYQRTQSVSIFKKFITWCQDQEKNRLLWLGIILSAHGCILTPVAIFTVVASGTNIFLFMTAIVAMGMTLVTNLAALPTKITIPVFILSILIDIAIIFSALAMGIDIAKTYI